MTTETTYTCPGMGACGAWATTGVRGEPVGAQVHEPKLDSDHHPFVPHKCDARCDAEVWRAAGCDALYQRTEGWYECNCVGGVHRLRASITGRLAPIMSAPETPEAWQGVRVLLEEAIKRGFWPQITAPEDGLWVFFNRPNNVTAGSAELHPRDLATLPAAIGAAFKEAVKHG